MITKLQRNYYKLKIMDFQKHYFRVSRKVKYLCVQFYRTFVIIQ